MQTYNIKSPFEHMHPMFIFVSVQQMYDMERSMLGSRYLLTDDEMMDIYLMQIGAMPSEIGVY